MARQCGRAEWLKVQVVGADGQRKVNLGSRSAVVLKLHRLGVESNLVAGERLRRKRQKQLGEREALPRDGEGPVGRERARECLLGLTMLRIKMLSDGHVLTRTSIMRASGPAVKVFPWLHPELKWW